MAKNKKTNKNNATQKNNTPYYTPQPYNISKPTSSNKEIIDSLHAVYPNIFDKVQFGKFGNDRSGEYEPGKPMRLDSNTYEIPNQLPDSYFKEGSKGRLSRDMFLSTAKHEGQHKIDNFAMNVNNQDLNKKLDLVDQDAMNSHIAYMNSNQPKAYDLKQYYRLSIDDPYKSVGGGSFYFNPTEQRSYMNNIYSRKPEKDYLTNEGYKKLYYDNDEYDLSDFEHAITSPEEMEAKKQRLEDAYKTADKLMGKNKDKKYYKNRIEDVGDSIADKRRDKIKSIPGFYNKMPWQK